MDSLNAYKIMALMRKGYVIRYNERRVGCELDISYMAFFIDLIKRVILFLSMLSIRTSKIIVFGAWFGEKYSDNSKALFEYASKHSEKKCIWITNSKEICRKLKMKGYIVYLKNSLKGVYYQLRAKTIISCTGNVDVNKFIIGNAIHINLWHGVGGGKKIGFDDPKFNNYANSPKGKFFAKLEAFPLRKQYFVCTSEVMKKVFKSAFRLDDNQFIMAGQPRNDMFFDSGYKISSFDASTFANKRVILYLPTHRLEGKKKMYCSELFDLERLNLFCEKNNCIFLIKKHFYHKNEYENLSLYSNIIDWTQIPGIDTNELLMIADFLISDYSSVTADYLLLNRPILYYCFDLENYLKEDRDMYWPYDEITPGPKCSTFNELMLSLKTMITDDKDEYIYERERVLGMFYNPHARKMVCQDILDAVDIIIKEMKRT